MKEIKSSVFKVVFTFLILQIGSGCTILNRNIAIYSKDKKLETDSRYKIDKESKQVSTEGCARILLFIPLGTRNHFDVLESTFAENPEYNLLTNATITSKMFTLGLYTSVCHEVKGTLIKTHKESSK